MFTQDSGINLPHLSPSTVNSFITDKFQFYKSKVQGIRFQGNEYTVRGQAIEGAINLWVENGDENFVENAYKLFDEKIKETRIMEFEYREVRDSLKGLVEVAAKFYREEFSERPAITQRKVEGNLEGVRRTVLGYLDYSQDKMIRDCKVVSKTPSKLSQSYCIQGAFYREVEKKPVVFDFFVANKTPVQKSIILSDDEFLFGKSYLIEACKILEELQECEDPKRVMYLMSFPNLEAIYNATERALVSKEFGIELR